MTTFERCPKAVEALAKTILEKHESHKPVLVAKVTIDFVFAYPEYDEKTGKPLGDALTKNGVKALGITRKIPLKDRALGRADAEIALDGDWWDKAPEREQEALLDHELHHVAVKIDKRGLVTDDLGRPVLQLRKHTHEIGWFAIVAERNGKHSIEQQQARAMLDEAGQFYWPEFSKLLKA
jgi:hypothetical protein